MSYSINNREPVPAAVDVYPYPPLLVLSEPGVAYPVARVAPVAYPLPLPAPALTAPTLVAYYPSVAEVARQAPKAKLAVVYLVTEPVVDPS